MKRKAALESDPRLRALVDLVGEFFSSFFSVVNDLNNSSLDDEKFLARLRERYDKYCRTKNPIAHLVTDGAFSRCVRAHHDDLTSIHDRLIRGRTPDA